MTRPGFRLTGLAAWWVQRLSALYMLAFLMFMLTALGIDPVHDYAQWLARVGRPGTELALATFFAALLSHLWVGLRDVLLDYAKPPALQRLVLAAVAVGLLAIALWVIRILVSLPR